MLTNIDLIQSTVLGAVILLLVLRLNSSLNDTSTDQISTSLTERSAMDVGAIMKNDLSKMGYMVPTTTPVITYADTMGNITFKADINASTAWVDSIRYQVVRPANGGLLQIKRRVNAGTSRELNAKVDSLVISYYRSGGIRIPSSMLATQAGRDSIRSMKLSIRYGDPLRHSGGTTQAPQATNVCAQTSKTLMEQTIAPRNIQYSR